MITLTDERSGSIIGTISDAQLQELTDNLEEEWSGDTDYYINEPTIDLLEANGIDAEVIGILRTAIAATGEADLRWTRAN